MHWLVRGCWVGGLVAVLALTLPPAGRAEQAAAATPERVRFETFDQVEIHASFYAGLKGNKSPCVMLLHALGGTSHDEGWDELAQELHTKGYAVLRFDFRGHGSSTNVAPAFWTLDLQNRSLRSFKPDRLKTTIGYKDFTTLYHYTTLVNDIAAAKRFLDRKNDGGECNAANLVVIGAESGATLGALWIATEWHRRRLTSLAAAGQAPIEGKDISCAIWLSMASTLGTHQVRVADWLRSPVRENVPMYFLYGEGDNRSGTLARHLYDNILKATKSKEIKLSAQKAIPGTKLAGRELLGKGSLGTEALMMKYLEKVVEERASNPYARRDVDKTLLYPVPFQRFLR